MYILKGYRFQKKIVCLSLKIVFVSAEWLRAKFYGVLNVRGILSMFEKTINLVNLNLQKLMKVRKTAMIRNL